MIHPAQDGPLVPYTPNLALEPINVPKLAVFGGICHTRPMTKDFKLE